MSAKETQPADQMDVAYVARLARLQLADEEVRTFGEQLQQVVAHIRKINQLDLRGIEPTSHAHPVRNVFRKDEVKPGLERDAVLANAPVHGGEQFIVPKIVE